MTFATLIYELENLLYLILDNPDLAGRFRDTILRAMLAMADVTGTEPRGFQFTTTTAVCSRPRCTSFSPSRFSRQSSTGTHPNPGDWWFQHSDSAMGHLLPILARLGFTG